MNRTGTSNLIALCKKIAVNARFDGPRLRGVISTTPEESEALQEAAQELERLALVARANDRYPPKEEKKPMHPATASILEEFEYDHLPEKLQAVSAPICHLAHAYAEIETSKGAELTAGLRKLLEAKDCLVRAARGSDSELPINPRIINLNFVPDTGVAPNLAPIVITQEQADAINETLQRPEPQPDPVQLLTAISNWAERHTAGDLGSEAKNHFRRVAVACNDLAYHIRVGNIPPGFLDPIADFKPLPPDDRPHVLAS